MKRHLLRVLSSTAGPGVETETVSFEPNPQTEILVKFFARTLDSLGLKLKIEQVEVTDLEGTSKTT